MASLSDQIDRLSQNTRSIKATASSIASTTAHDAAIPSTFTRAVLNTHLGDLIRDVDPSELGLFRLVQGPSDDAYSKDSKHVKEPGIRRTEFTAATPLRKNASRRDDKQEIQPEVYAHAALKYIEQYEPIRPMPRAYDQIVAILDKVNSVRANINTLSDSLEKATVNDKAPSAKARLEQEEKRVKELQARIAELSKLKEEKEAQARKPVPTRPNPAPSATSKEVERQKTPLSPSSPMEDKFWATKGEPSRTLRFSENLLDEEVNLGDMSTDSFGTPIAIPAQVPRLSLFADPDFVDEPTITQFPPLDLGPSKSEELATQQPKKVELPSSPSPVSIPSTPETPSLPPPAAKEPTPSKSRVTETPGTKQRRIRMNPELEKIVNKIWSTVGDIISPSYNSDEPHLSAKETIAFLEELSAKVPQSESPSISSASSASIDGTGLPTFQQIQIAYFLTMLLSSTSNYSMPLNVVKENLGQKAKSSGVAAAGTGPTKVIFTCMGKRLVKIDRGGGEQIVRFDV